MRFLLLLFLPFFCQAQDTKYWHVVEDSVLSLQTPYAEFQPVDTAYTYAQYYEGTRMVVWNETYFRKVVTKALLDHSTILGDNNGDTLVGIKEENYEKLITEIIRNYTNNK